MPLTEATTNYFTAHNLHNLAEVEQANCSCFSPAAFCTRELLPPAGLQMVHEFTSISHPNCNRALHVVDIRSKPSFQPMQPLWDGEPNCIGPVQAETQRRPVIVHGWDAGRAHVWTPRHRQDHAGQGCGHCLRDHLLQHLLIHSGFQVQVSSRLPCQLLFLPSPSEHAFRLFRPMTLANAWC